MSSPTGVNDETRSQDSVHASLQYAAETALEDTASSVRGMGPPPGVTVQVLPERPNATFVWRMRDTRARSVSPRPHKVVSPSLSVAQLRARAAEQTAATAASGVGRVEEETRRVREMVEATTAEAKSVRDDVESRVAVLAAAADTSATRMGEEIASRVRQVAEYSDAQASRVAADVTQRLEKEIEAAATSTAATAEVTTRTVVEGVRRDIQAQIEQNRADALRREQEAQSRITEISQQLQTLTDQLNKFQPASEFAVGVTQEKLSEKVQQQFDAQSDRIEKLSETVLESKKESQTTADILKDLLVGMENLGENFKTMQQEMNAWQSGYHDAEEEYREMNEQILKEVPLASQAEIRPVMTENPPIISIPPAVSSQFTSLPMYRIPQPSFPMVEERDDQTMDEAIKARWAKFSAMRANVPISTVQASQATIPQFFNVKGSQKGMPYPGLDGHQRRITPIPVSSSEKPSLIQQKNELSEEEYRRQGYRQVAQTMFGAKIRDTTDEEQFAESEELSAWTGGAGRPTIGETSISTQEAERIRAEVRAVMHEQFAEGRAALRANLGLPQEKSSQSDKAAPSGTVIDLVSESAGTPENVKPRSSFGSPVSVTHAVSSPTTVNSRNQSFATAAWKPKEPPCFFGRSTEDAHTWVSLVRNYLTFMSGSDSQQVAYTVTLFREAAHEWYMSFERRNRGPPRDWAGLVAALLDRFGSNIRSQEAQSQLMSISQGQRAVRDYASQFETLLGRLDSYDEGLMLNQFIWGLQPDLARSVSLHYPTSIAKAVSLAETTELAVKASRRPNWKSSTAGNPTKGPNTQNRGRGQWRGRGGSRGGFRGGSSMGSSGSTGSRSGGRRGRGGRNYSANFDPLACYRCGVRGHLARDCPQTGAAPQGSSNAGSSRGTFVKSGHKGPQRGRGRGRQVRFSGLNVLYDDEGNSYPIDETGQLYVPLDFGQAVAESAEVETPNEIKN